jgi:peptidoglycan/xylan/chitin deacetylase (PgdA/CDA1 family)
MHFQHSDRFTTAESFATYVTDAYDCLWREGERWPRTMSIGLHLRMIGRPGRIAALERILAHFSARGGEWLATREQIARVWQSTAG